MMKKVILFLLLSLFSNDVKSSRYLSEIAPVLPLCAVAAFHQQLHVVRSSSYEDPSLERKIGRMFVVGTSGTTIENVPNSYKEALRKGNIGGFIPYNYNVENQSQIEALIKDLRTSCGDNPFVVVVDVEGGRVNRFKSFMPLLSPKEAGDLYTQGARDTLRSSYQEAGAILKAVDVDMVLGPVVDIHKDTCPVIGGISRSFSSDVEIIENCAEIFIRALEKYGIKACLKHFPGHGSSTEDTHVGYVDVTSTFDQKELGPYRKLIKKRVVDAVMPAHVVNGVLDASKTPSSLSRSIQQDLLRRDLGFSGLIVSDAMDMGAITTQYLPEEAAVMAIKAGTTMLIYSCNSAAGGRKNSHSVDDMLETVLMIQRHIAKECKSDKDLLMRINQSYDLLNSIFGKGSRKVG